MNIEEITAQASRELSLRIVGCCGKGTFGVVYLATDQLERRVALKIVDKKRLGPSWEREYRGISNYCQQVRNHSNLIEIYHVKDFPDYFCYTMEAADNYYEGDDAKEYYCADTLATRFKNGLKIGVDEMLRIAEDLLAGLEVLHDQGLIHRDIKPSNVIFVNGQAKLGDMGLITNFMESSSFAGTAEYLPPELIRQDNGTPRNDTSGDLYALGKVLYCILSGLPASSFPEMPVSILGEKDILRLNKFFLEACSDDRSRRFTSIRDFRDALRRCCHPKRHGVLWWASIVGVAALVIAASALPLALRLRSGGKDETASPEPQARQSNAAPHEKPSVLATEPVIMTLEQRLLQARKRLEELLEKGMPEHEIDLKVALEKPEQIFMTEPRTLKIAFRKAQIKCLLEKRSLLEKSRNLNERDFDPKMNEAFRQRIAELLRPENFNIQKGRQKLVEYANMQLRSGQINPNMKFVMHANDKGNDRELTLLQLFMEILNGYIGQENICAPLLSYGADVDEAFNSKLIDMPNARYVIRNGALDKMGGLLLPLVKMPTMRLSQPYLAKRHSMEAKNIQETISSLLLQNHSIDDIDILGNSAIHYTAKGEALPQMLLLLCADADPNAKNRQDETPLILATKSSTEDMIRLLHHFGADASAADKEGKTAEDYIVYQNFRNAVNGNDLGKMRTMLEKGFDPNVIYSDNETPLLKAVISDNPEMVQLLLENNAKMDLASINNMFYHPLFATMTRNNGHRRLEIFKLLLKHGANVNISSNITPNINTRITMFGLICTSNRLIGISNDDEILPFIDAAFEASIKPSLYKRDGNSRQSWVYSIVKSNKNSSREKIILRLLREMPDLDEDDFTLNLAIANNFSDELISEILKHKPNMKCEQGHGSSLRGSPMQIAMSKGRMSVVKMLREYEGIKEQTSDAALNPSLHAYADEKWMPGPNADWSIEWNDALEKARRENKAIYVLNTGSDWCGWCKRLRNEVLDKKEFQEYASRHLALLYLDAPHKTKLDKAQEQHNDFVRRALAFDGGVPNAVLLSPKGQLLGKIRGGALKLKEYILELERLLAEQPKPLPHNAKALFDNGYSPEIASKGLEETKAELELKNKFKARLTGIAVHAEKTTDYSVLNFQPANGHFSVPYGHYAYFRVEYDFPENYSCFLWVRSSKNIPGMGSHPSEIHRGKGVACGYFIRPANNCHLDKIEVRTNSSPRIGDGKDWIILTQNVNIDMEGRTTDKK